MQLFSYYRSSAAYRVRIALELKGIQYGITPVNIATGEQRSAGYLADNPQGLVPSLKLDSGAVISQSLAILEWLEEAQPQHPLYPHSQLQRAQYRALCQHIACDIHPLNNLRVLSYLRDELQQPQQSVDRWYAHWIQSGFRAIEAAVQSHPGRFSLDADPGMLEVMLVPQVYNARRFHVDLTDFPGIVALDARCQLIDAFAKAHPLAQPDAPETERR